jgi:hypothetical protein
VTENTTNSAELRQFAADNTGRRKIDVEASLDLHRRAANHIDALNEHVNDLRHRVTNGTAAPAPAPPVAAPAAGEPAVLHYIVIDAGKLEAVLVAAAADIVNIQIVEKEKLGGGVIAIITAVIDVDAIVEAVSNHQVMQNHKAWANQVEPLTAAGYDGRGLAGGPTDPDGRLRTPMQIIEK